MKAWWQNLSPRERSMMISLSLVACVLLIYFIIWAPISNGVSTLKQNVSDNRALLSWMQQATSVLQKNQSADDAAGQNTPADQRLAVIQTSLKDTSFNKHVTQIEQTNQNDVRVVITSADFDTLTDWFVLLWKQNGIIVSEASLKRLNNQGLVSANIILTGRKSS